MRKQIFSIAVAAAFAIPSLANAYVEVQTVEEDKVLVSFDVSQTAYEKAERVLNELSVQLQSGFAVLWILVSQDHCLQRRTTGLVSGTPLHGP
jgi:hypothetical protein|tara:strand:- start:185 stop:463 length:279 start_codon:yes stop_codon:yes gene_type:complete